jgi:hypothetical protein
MDVCWDVGLQQPGKESPRGLSDATGLRIVVLEGCRCGSRSRRWIRAWHKPIKVDASSSSAERRTAQRVRRPRGCYQHICLSGMLLEVCLVDSRWWLGFKLSSLHFGIYWDKAEGCVSHPGFGSWDRAREPAPLSTRCYQMEPSATYLGPEIERAQTSRFRGSRRLNLPTTPLLLGFCQ